jgi:hypothetical protein
VIARNKHRKSSGNPERPGFIFFNAAIEADGTVRSPL